MTPPTEEGTRKRSPADYVFGKVIGEGSYSTVYLAKDVSNSKEFAIKVLEKRHIFKERKTEYVMREKDVLKILGNSCSYFVHLYETFQDTERLYFVLTYAKNGELLKQINKLGCFSIESTRYYAAELLLALEFLHSKQIIHRDLKPENILFDENWHILITDFGSAKILSNTESSEKTETRRKNSFVGTAQYVSPEMLSETISCYSSDLWAFGCIIYQLVSGKMPFRGPSEYLIFQKILKLDYEFPEEFDKVAKDLVEKLLVKDHNDRLGAKDTEPYSSIRAHEFFKGIDFNNLGPTPLSEVGNFNVSLEHIIPDNLEPGLDEEKASMLHLDLLAPKTPVRKKSKESKKITDLTELEIKKLLEEQTSNEYNSFVDGHLILKQGLLDKRKGLIPRRRMFLLTMGPHIYYVDPATKVLKGEIPFSEELRPEARNFKQFFIHTPNRRYNLEDPSGHATEWCKAIEEVRSHYFP